MDSDEARMIYELLEKNNSTVIKRNDFSYIKKSSIDLKVEYNGEKILEKRFRDCEPKHIQRYPAIVSEMRIIYSFSENVNGWEYTGDSTDYFASWITPYGHEITISYQGDGTGRLNIPSRGIISETDVLKGSSRTSIEGCIIQAVDYMKNIPAHQIDYRKLVEAKAKEKFKEISGIGSRTASDLIRDEIFSFEELLNRGIGRISQNYQKEAKRDIKHKIENDDTVENNPKIREFKLNRVVADL